MRFLAIILLFSVPSYGQLMTLKGPSFFSQEDAIIKVEGTLVNDSSAMTHHGLIVVDSSFMNNTAGVINGNGEYQVFVNWKNSGTFVADTSHVRLNGAAQLITGDSITTFYNLSLENAGVKTQTISAITSNRLDLNNLELNTDQFSMTITNPALGSVMFDNTFGSEGFVSSDFNGALIRNTASTGTYLFPTGSSLLVGSSLRAVEVTPNSASSNAYSVSLQPVDPTLDGFDVSLADPTICSINTNFYHKIDRTSGTESVDLGITYLVANDGVWQENSNWTGSQWDTVGSNLLGTTSTGYDIVTTSGYGAFGVEPYSLSNFSPNSAILAGDTIVCGNTSGVLYVDNTSWSGTYSWVVSGGTITAGAGTDSIYVDFSASGTGYVTLTLSDPLTGCSSINNDTLLLTFSGLANDSIEISDTLVYSGDLITVNNPASDNVSWNWDWDNGYGSSSQSDQLYYSDTGWFNIQLIVANSTGCIDTNTVWVRVLGNTTLPNVFTPNFDGSNDLFSFDVSAFGDFTMTIYNRWGQVVHVMKKGDEFWDGTTLTGEVCPEGTYIYELLPNEGDAYAGHVMLNR